MDKFTRTLRGYDPIEVNAFLDQVITQVEKMNRDLKAKDNRIMELEAQKNNSAPINSVNTSLEVQVLKDKLTRYENMEQTLNRAILMAERTSEQMKLTASRESELIVDSAKKNANRIVNDALLKAENTEREAAMLKRNINVFKRRLRDVIEEQLQMVDEIEKIDF